MKTMIEIVKEIEKKEGYPCEIEVTIVRPNKIEKNKYGELEKRSITVSICKGYQKKILNEVLEKDKRNMEKVLFIVQSELPKIAGRYKSVKRLSKKLEKLEGNYSVLKNGIYWDTGIGHPGWYSIIKGPIAKIEYELTNKNRKGGKKHVSKK